MNRIGFDNEKYLAEQTDYITRRLEEHAGGKLYVECGGKLLFDYHASRVLPGFDPNVKMRVFSSLMDKIDVIICIHAKDIEHRKIRSDFGITYDTDVFKMIDDFASWGLKCDKVVITRFEGEKSALMFKSLLENRGINVYIHKPTKGYPSDVDLIVSDDGYGANPYIPTEKPLVIVTAPGPGSGKLATCLSQVYHDWKEGRKSAYSKFETFPIWNLPIDHPVNVSYEAATADIGDFNMIDHYYLASTGKIAVNYNRDLEAFPLLKRILEKITGGESEYNSPTEMGVNRCAFGIFNDENVREAANQEIIRRYYRAACEQVQGIGTKETVARNVAIMEKSHLSLEMRPTVVACQEALNDAISGNKGKDGIVCAAAIELKDGSFVTAHNSSLMHASTALVFNALKKLAGIAPEIDLIPNAILVSVTKMKKDQLNEKSISMNLDEGLICLAMSAPLNEYAKRAIEHIPDLSGCEAHMSHIPSSGDWKGLRKMGMNVTSEPKFATTNMFMS